MVKKMRQVNKKILKQVEYESARRKRHNNEKTRKSDKEGSTFFMYIYRGNSRELKGTQSFSREALVQVIEGKN